MDAGLAESDLRKRHRRPRRSAGRDGADGKLARAELIRAAYRVEIAAALAAWAGEPSQWGRDDCALAIANIDRKVIKVDPAKGWRRRYGSEAGAKRAMGKRGVLGMATSIARAMKWTAIAPSAAQDGDRGVGVTPGGLTCLIRYRGFWVGRCDLGNWLALDTQMVKVWSIV